MCYSHRRKSLVPNLDSTGSAPTSLYSSTNSAPASVNSRAVPHTLSLLMQPSLLLRQHLSLCTCLRCVRRRCSCHCQASANSVGTDHITFSYVAISVTALPSMPEHMFSSSLPYKKHGVFAADPAIIAKHQPIVWGTDRITTSYDAISALASKPDYLLTFNEPNFLSGGGGSNVVDPATAAGLWPQLTGLFDPLGVQLIAPSPLDCTGDPSCRNVETAAGWLSAFQTVSSQLASQ